MRSTKSLLHYASILMQKLSHLHIRGHQKVQMTIQPRFGHLDPRALPSWWTQLRLLHERHGMIECLEEGNVIYVSSWYLHANRLQQCHVPRALRFDQHWHDWFDIIRETWHDHLQQDLPVDIGVVTPHPATIFEGHVAHLILCQAIHPALSVGIASGIFRSSSHDASSTRRRCCHPHSPLMKRLLWSQHGPQCVHRVCSSRLGHHPLSEDRPHPTSMYTSLVVEVHPEPDDEDDYSSFMAAGTHTHTRAPRFWDLLHHMRWRIIVKQLYKGMNFPWKRRQWRLTRSRHRRIHTGAIPLSSLYMHSLQKGMSTLSASGVGPP